MELSEVQLSEYLIKEKFIDKKKLEDVISFATNTEISLSEALLEKDILSDEKLGQITAKLYHLPFINLASRTVNSQYISLIPESVARKQKVLIYSKNGSVYNLAITDPTNQLVVQNLIQKIGKKIKVHLATERDFNMALKVYQPDLPKLLNDLISGQGSIPIDRIADLIINHAYQDKASDIHIEPDDKYCRIRFRLDGVLRDIVKLPKSVHERIISRIKVLSRMRTDEHLSPQDGKMKMKLETESLDIRVSIVPIVDGEKVVLRLLSSKSRQYSLSDLGVSSADLKKINRAIAKPYGMILSTGPTGSGKTTTIYSLLKILNTREKNITTIEDPVEYRIQGVNQIQVNPKANLNFSNGLRSILRQDPNIIFVGEIRDNDTAAIAVNAALTGHLVLSTLHTNDAATSLPRFIDMQVEPFLIASTINIIIAQRLVRRLCPKCAQPVTISLDELAKKIPPRIIKRNFGSKKEIKVYQENGCEFCYNTGFYGRTGIFEVIEINQNIRHLITQKAEIDDIVNLAIKQGMTPMIDDGLQKVLKGETSINEVIKVTNIESL